MTLFDNTKPKKIVADEGKHIRVIDENNEPYYATIIFVPDNFTEEQMNELYVEEPEK